jgi:hypothetical protein
MGHLEEEVELLLEAGGDGPPGMPERHGAVSPAEFSELDPQAQNALLYARLLAMETAVRRIARAVDRAQRTAAGD